MKSTISREQLERDRHAGEPAMAFGKGGLQLRALDSPQEQI